jgi:hypothetical protein
MELVGIRDIQRIIAKDAPAVSSNCKQFAIDNEFGYYVICNTWLLIVKEFSEYGWMHLLDAISRRGLNSLISEAQDCAAELLESGDITGTIFRPIWHDVAKCGYNPRTPDNEKEIGRHPIATMLMVLRYPKRFSPVGNDKIQAASLKKFLEVENRTKLLQRRGYSQYIMNFIHDVVEGYMPWQRIYKDIDNVLATRELTFTSGVGFDSRANLGSKLVAVSKYLPEYFGRPFGIPYCDICPEADAEYWGHYTWDTIRAVKVQAVPKSYKASRIIAMENTTRQGFARSIANVLDRYLPDSVPIHDQETNQNLAYFGSLTNQVATLDLSNASDCISKSLFFEILPKGLTDRIAPLLGTHTLIDGSMRVMQQMSTAGNALTFILESMIFDIICRASTKMYETWYGGPVLDKVFVNGKWYTLPSVYGDDQIVHVSVAELTIQVLEALGFIVNKAKSYTDGPYRESCGAEYYDGVDVSSFYYPRFPILGSIKEKVSISPKCFRDSYLDVFVDTRSSLISLQHRLYGVSYAASRFVWNLVIEDYPKMTRSLQGSHNSDLWDYEATSQLRKAPYGSTYVLRVRPWDPITKRARSYGPAYLDVIRCNGDRKCDSKAIDPAKVVWQVEANPEPEWYKRSYKISTTVQYKLKKPVTSHERKLLQLFRYYDFLRNGPRYSDDLSRLLKISDAPVTEEQAFGTPEMIWGFHESDED